MPTPDPRALPFDIYQRYRLVADLVGQLPGGEVGVKLLDVGGRTELLRRFLPDARVELVDVEASDAPGLVLGSGSALPFADNSFDVVAACDTLEHVPRELRADFVCEACRVARRWVVLAGPYHSERVVAAEDGLRAFLEGTLDYEHRYLNEHSERGLPVRAEVEELLGECGASVHSIGHGNLERWLALMSVSMYMQSDPQLTQVSERYNRLYNEALYGSDCAEPVYRHAVVGCLAGAPAPSAEALFEAPLPPGAGLEQFRMLAGELVAFDRERDVYEAERDRLLAVNAGLEADLDGHKARAAEVSALHAEQAEVIENLERDLKGHRRLLEEIRTQVSSQEQVIDELEGELEQQRDSLEVTRHDLEGHRRVKAALARVTEEQERTIVTLEEDLAGHRDSLLELEQDRRDRSAVVAELEQALREHRSELGLSQAELKTARSEHAEVRSELEGQLANHRTLASDLEAELHRYAALAAELSAERDERADQQRALEEDLRRVNELATRMNDELVAEREANEELRGELRDRFRILKRALTPRKLA